MIKKIPLKLRAEIKKTFEQNKRSYQDGEVKNTNKIIENIKENADGLKELVKKVTSHSKNKNLIFTYCDRFEECLKEITKKANRC